MSSVKAVGARLLALDDPVCAHLPEFGTKGKEAITLRHVLTHTGGFRFAAAQWSSAPWNEIIAEIYDSELEAGWVPGEHAGYYVSSGWYVLWLVFNGMTDQARHDARMRTTLNALYADLGLAAAGEEADPRVFDSLDSALRSKT